MFVMISINLHIMICLLFAYYELCFLPNLVTNLLLFCFKKSIFIRIMFIPIGAEKAYTNAENSIVCLYIVYVLFRYFGVYIFCLIRSRQRKHTHNDKSKRETEEVKFIVVTFTCPQFSVSGFSSVSFFLTIQAEAPSHPCCSPPKQREWGEGARGCRGEV